MSECGVRDGDYGTCNQPFDHPEVVHRETRDGQIWAEWRSVTAEDELTGSALRCAYVAERKRNRSW